MTKRLFEILSILILWTLFYACIDDKTSGFKTDGSPITITVQDIVFDVELGSAVMISPDVSQVETDLPLTYEWRAIAVDGGTGADSLRFISTEKELNYKFDRSGIFEIRLRVENKYGSEFQSFIVNVLAPFEVGILVLSNDDQDNGRLSFLRAKNENEVLDKTESNFNLNAFFLNSDIKLRGVRDAAFVVVDNNYRNLHSQLVILSETDGMLYFTESTSLLVEYAADVTSFLPGLKPTTLCSTAEGVWKSLFFGTKDAQGNPGDLYIMNTVEHFVFPDLDYFPGDATYDKLVSKFDTEDKYRWTTICCIDNTHKLLHLMNKYQAFDLSAFMQGRTVINAGFYDENSNGEMYRVVLVMKDDAAPNQISIYRSKNRFLSEKEPFDGAPYVYTDNDITLTSDCNLVSSDKYQYFFYNNEHEIYRWTPYLTSEPKLPSKPIITLPDADDVITCMTVSPEGQYLYVCVYNKNAKTDLKGKLLVFDIDKMELKKTFEGISDRAVKVMWKEARFFHR